MKLLFFDCEFASVRKQNYKICEFGYFLCNEKFEEIESNNFIIDPNIGYGDWDDKVLREVLTHSVDSYELGYNFNYYYNKIKSLIDEADLIFGHTLDSDINALKCECVRYHKENIDFEYYEIKDIYNHYLNLNYSVGLKTMLDNLKIENTKTAHDAFNDAYDTMLVLKYFADEKSLDLVLNECDDAKHNSLFETSISYSNKTIKEVIDYLNNKSKDKRISKSKLNLVTNLYIRKMPIAEGGKLSGKKVSLSVNYAKANIIKAMNLAKIIASEGGTYFMKATSCDIFINYEYYNKDNEVISDSRLEAVRKCGRDIKIVSFNEFLDFLGINEDDLARKKIEADFLYLEEEQKNSESLGELFGDFFKEFQSVK